ncbi:MULTISPECIES: endonuclease/exonuclease/phosphatase family protein [Myxococcaceae]|uniref:endonuclease/exonuclease/phosphatase family protein n=1 Tax=Myxococcaceae TaxID=31 RepID=UPI00188FBAAD|nr:MULTISPECIES: endonuclease/exonuclease/phosphatase family protein [Myxococcaceae]MBF5041959.1 endonuclease/exonuclease/phosphatase family protein [Simulacricoccus sp. 17bor-14]
MGLAPWLLLGLLLLPAGCRSRSASAAEAPPPPRAPMKGESLRLVTYNVYNRPWRRAARTHDAAELLAQLQPDVVLLQEVSRYAHSKDVPSARFAQRLGLQDFTYWMEDGLLFSGGQALLSRYPLREVAGHPFSKDYRIEAKGFVHAVLATPAGDVGLVGVHMAAVKGGKVKAQQFAELQAFVEGLRARMPVLVAGDFNEEPTTPLSQAFRRALGAQSLYEAVGQGDPKLKSYAPYPRPCTDPQAELIDDMLLVPAHTPHAAQLSFTRGGIQQGPTPVASDHCPVAATIQLMPPPPDPG